MTSGWELRTITGLGWLGWLAIIEFMRDFFKASPAH
jgi:hypothetical protein